MTEGKRHHPPASRRIRYRDRRRYQDALKDLLGGTIKEMMELKWMTILDMKRISVLTARLS